MYRFRLYGISELNALLNTLNKCFYDWLTEVVDQSLPFTLTVQPCDEAEFTKTDWRSVVYNDLTISYFLPNHFSEQLATKAGWSEGISSQNNSSVWNNTIIDCIDMLLQKILVVSVNTSIEKLVSLNSNVQDIWTSRGSGYLCYNIFLGKDSLKLVIPPNLVEALIGKDQQPVTPVTKSDLTDRLNAASSNSLDLELVAGNVEVRLGDLHMLAAGHVIPLDNKIDQPLQLRVAGGQTIGKAYLAACGENKAIYLTGK